MVAGTFKTHWVRDAVFYFEAETDLRSLVLQRRRWLNGTNAGYIYILLNLKKLVWDSPHSSVLKFTTSSMLAIQMIQIFVSPAQCHFQQVIDPATQYCTAEC